MMRYDQTQRTQQSVLELPDESQPSIQYLAGFFDGEGCLSADVPPTKDGRPIQFTIVLATAKEAEPEWYHKLFGGTFSEINSENPNHSTQWVWRTTGRKARFAAENLYPHLQSKKEQAGVFIEALKFKQSCGHNYTEKQKEKLEEYSKRVRSFSAAQSNFKGGN